MYYQGKNLKEDPFECDSTGTQKAESIEHLG
jgi:hypothetical protein